MIQDIAPHRLDNHYDPARQPKEDDLVICYQDRKMLVCIDEEEKRLRFPKIADTKMMKDDVRKYIYLFEISGQGFFLNLMREPLERDVDGTISRKSNAVISTRDDSIIMIGNESFQYVDMNRIRACQLKPQEYVYASFTAMHLAEWYLSERFCGCCGKPLHHDAVERAMTCDHCKRKIYPRLNPAVIVGVIHGNRLLITRYRQGYRHNALIAGFTEIGETLEETVKREVAEETGIRVKNIRYYKSQPWGVAGDILAGFFCEAEGDTQIHMDSDELRYAEWVEREDIQLQPADYSLTNEMMKVFKES